MGPPQVQADRWAESALHEPGAVPPQVRSAVHGATYGWSEDLTSAEFAAVKGAENAYRKATGEPVPFGMGEAFHATQHAQREDREKFEKEHPKQALGFEVAGALKSPGGKALSEFAGRGMNWLTRAVRSGLTGTAIGGVSGGSGEGEDGKGAEKGAIFGGVLSTGMHLMGSAVTRGLPAAASYMEVPMAEAWNGIQKAFGAEHAATPEELKHAQTSALEYVSKLAKAAKERGVDLANNAIEKMQKPIVAAEAMGRTAINQLGALGKRAGETPDKLESAMRTRNQYAGSRIYSDLSELTAVDPHAIEGDFKNQLVQLRKEASPYYDVAYTKKADTPALRALLDRPSMDVALSRARRIAREEGIDPETVGLSLKATQDIGAHGDKALELVEVKNPTMRTWDYIKRGLDDELNKDRDKLTKRLDLDEEGRAVNSTLQALRKELFKESPEYEIALAHGGEAPRQKEAYDAARQLMGSNITEEAFKTRLSAMTPAQKEAFKGGVIADIFNRVRNNKMKIRDLQSPAMTEKLRQTLGFESAETFLAKADAEARLAANSDRITPGRQSITSEIALADTEREADTHSMAQAAFKMGQGKFLESINALSKLGAIGRTSQLNETMRDEVGRLLMLKPSELSKELGRWERTHGSTRDNAARSFVRNLARDPKALAAAQRIANVSAEEIGLHQ